MTCRTMQKRIMELIEQVQNEDVTGLPLTLLLFYYADITRSIHGFAVVALHSFAEDHGSFLSMLSVGV